MKKLSILTLTLAIVTSSLIASCSSNSGQSNHQSNNKSNISNGLINQNNQNKQNNNSSNNNNSINDNSSKENPYLYTQDVNYKFAENVNLGNLPFDVNFYNNININKAYAIKGYKPNRLNSITVADFFLDFLKINHMGGDENNVNNNYFISNFPIGEAVTNNNIVYSSTFGKNPFNALPDHEYGMRYTPKSLVIGNTFKRYINNVDLTTKNMYFKKLGFIDLKNISTDFYWNEDNSNLGFNLSFIIAGETISYNITDKNSQYFSGIASNTFLNYAGFNINNQNVFYKELTYIPKIFENNSDANVIYLALGNESINPFEESKPLLVQLDYDLLKRSLDSLTDEGKINSVVILPTGNYTKFQYTNALKDFYNVKGHDFLTSLYVNPNSGLKLTKDHPLSKIVNSKEYDNVIVVGGAVYDEENSSINLDYNLNNTAKIINSIDSSFDPNKVQSQYKLYKSNRINLFNDKTTYKFTYNGVDYVNKGNIYSPLGSYQCGYAELKCLVAPYSYHQYNTIDRTTNKYKGTEYAAAYVAGASLLVKEKFPWMDNKNIVTTLLTTATDIGEPGIDDVYGWGVLNINRALRGPAQFAFGDFNIYFKNYSHSNVEPLPYLNVVKLFTTDPFVDNYYLKQATIRNNLSLYNFYAVTGSGGLNINPMTQSDSLYKNLNIDDVGLRDGLRIVYPGYTGNTKVNNSLLILEYPYFSKKYYTTNYTNEIYYKKDGLPVVFEVNNDKETHPNAYKHRQDIENSKAKLFETKVNNKSDKIVAQDIGTSSEIYNYENDQDNANVNKLKELNLNEGDYFFKSEIYLKNSILVNELPYLNKVDLDHSYFIPYSLFTYGSNNGYHHNDPYFGTYIHNFHSSESNIIIGIFPNPNSPYKNDDKTLINKTVQLKNKDKPVAYNYYFNDPENKHSFARTNNLVSTSIFADNADIEQKTIRTDGNFPTIHKSYAYTITTFYIYFNSGNKLNKYSQVKSNNDFIKLDSIPYIPMPGISVSLLNAVNSNFWDITSSYLFDYYVKVKFLNSSDYSIFGLSDAYRRSDFINGYDSIVVDIKPYSSTDRVTLASGHSVLDTKLLANSASSLDHLYTKADQQYFGTNTNQNYLALASAAQSSDNSNFRTYLYQNALTIYPDLQLASSQNTHTQVSNFIDRVSTNYLHSASHSVYFDYNYRQTNWTSPTSAVFGQDKGHNLSLGYYGQSYGLNYGIAGIVNYGNWQEDLTSLNADLAHLQANNLTSLASAKTLSAGLVASLGKALPRSFYALNLATTFHNYDLNRNLLFLTESTKFNALDLELAGRYGYSLVQTDHARFSVIGGLSLVDNYRLAIKETAAINPSKLEQVTGNTDAQAVAEQFAYTSLDAKAHNTLNVYASLALDYTYNFKLLNFNQALSIQTKAERVLNDLNFNVNSETNGSSLASTSVFNNNYIISAKANYKVNFTTSFSVDVYASYSMCQNWHTKTAGTSLTYSF